MKKFFKILSFFLVLFSSINSQVVENGVIDFRNEEFSDNQLFKLNGEWEFYFNKTYNQITDTTSYNYITVPSNWHDAGYPKKGYAVYRVVILLPKQSNTLFLDVKKQSNNYNLYVNGIKKASVGKFGVTEKNSAPDYNLVTISLPHNTDTVDLVFEVSNFHYRKAGLWENIYIGRLHKLQIKFKRQFAFDAILLGSLLVLLLYHLVLFLQVRKINDLKYKSLWLFSLLAFLALFRLGVTGQMLFKEIFPNFSWYLLVKIEFISFYLISGSSAKYLYELFPEEFSKKIANYSLIFTITISLITLFLPTFISSHFIIPLEVFTLLLIIYLFIGITKAFIKKRALSVHVLTAFIVVGVSALNDILYSQHIIETAYIFPVGIFVFFIIQAVSLSSQITSSYSKMDDLSKKLKDVNKNLELKVRQRTHKVEKQKEKLKEQALFLEVRNTELSQTIQELSDAKLTVDKINNELKLFSEITSKTDNAIVILDAKTRVQWVNEGFVKLYGYTLCEFQNLSENLIELNDDPEIKATYNFVVNNKVTQSYDIKVINKFDKEVWVRTTLTPIMDDNGVLVNIVAIDSDITLIKQAERKIINNNKVINKQKKELIRRQKEFREAFLNLQRLNNISKNILSNLNINELISSVYESVNELMDANGFGIGLFNKEKNRLEFSNYIEDGKVLPFDFDDLNDENSLAAWCFNNQQEIHISEVSREINNYIPDFKFTNHGEVSESLIYVPLTTKEKIGVITVKSFDKNAYRIIHLNLLRNLASFVAIALENSSIYKKLEKLSFVASKTDNYVLIVGSDDKIQWVNSGFENLTGFTLSEVVGKSPSQVIAGKHTEEKIVEKINKAVFVNNTVFKGELTHYKKNGEKFKAVITINPIVDEDKKLKHYFVIGADISEKEKYEKELQKQRDIAVEQKNNLIEAVKKIKQSENIIKEQNFELKQMSLVVSNTDNAVMIIKPTGEIEWVNSGFTKLYGFTFDEFKQRGNYIFNAATNVEIIKPVKKAIKYKKTVSYEVQLSKKDGSKIWVHTTWTPIFDDFGNLIKLLAIDSDISKQKENEEALKLINEEVSDFNEQITSSILYAQKIQNALLAPYSMIDEHIAFLKKNLQYYPEYFILYEPKDIVSGDFYWAKAFNNCLTFIAADCTGHGVPGAFMSALGIAFINDIVNGNENKPANVILNELREKVIQTLNQNDLNTETKDGMDITVVKINFETLQMQFAGAYQPLYHVKNNDNKLEIIKHRADRMPIGIHQNSHLPFKNNIIHLSQNDTLYLSSDGYISQFGGENNETFRSNRFRKLIATINSKNMAEQKEIIKNVFDKWTANTEQVDDILIVGIKIMKSDVNY